MNEPAIDAVLVDSKLGQEFYELSRSGFATNRNSLLRSFLLTQKLAVLDAHPENNRLIATSRLFAVGAARSLESATRRVMSLEPRFRHFLFTHLLDSLEQIFNDESLSKTLEKLDHITPELILIVRSRLKQAIGVDVPETFSIWTRLIWQSPDSVTLLSKVVESPRDLARLPTEAAIPVGFGWLEWETPPTNPAPAPWADSTSLESSLETVRHPFWGAMVATLDACTGDYEWQSLILRGDLLRSFHRTLGNAQFALDSLWRSEFGLYPVDPLVITTSLLGDHALPRFLMSDGRGSSCLPWLKIALDHLHSAEIAIESEGSWRLTDRFRTQLMRDDEHMMAFEAIRQRSYRLARAATKFSLATNKEVAAS